MAPRSVTRRYLRAAAAAAVVVAAVSGCTSVVDGSASRAAGSVTSDGVDLDVLATGNYPTSPVTYGAAGTAEVGVYLEGARLANYTVAPTDIDPAMVNYALSPATVLVDAESIDVIFRSNPDGTPNEVVAAIRAHNFMVGFGSYRFSNDGQDDFVGLRNAVLVFPDDAAAKAAATDMAAAHQREWPDIVRTPQPIPGYPDALATVMVDASGAWVDSFTPHGRYVLFQTAHAETPDATVDLVVRTLDAQGPLIDEFVPTDPAKYVDLPVDPTGLLARTILVDTAEEKENDNFSYEPDAALHFQTDPARSRELFEEVGMVAVASGKSVVYETSQDDGGARVVEEFAAEAVGTMGFAPSPGVMGMPNVQCFSFAYPNLSGSSDSLYYCMGSSGKYAFEAIGPQESDIHQVMAAEYLMLTAG